MAARTREQIGGLISWSFGFYVVVIASVVLAVFGLRAWRARKSSIQPNAI
jgi:predicted negative regulator of RcsB-dependent stress response